MIGVEKEKEINIIYFCKKNKISITTDYGDVLEIDYLSKTLNITKDKLIMLLNTSKINYYMFCEVLCFCNKTEARKTINIIKKLLC